MENVQNIVIIISSILIGIYGNTKFENERTIKNFLKVLAICLGMIVLNVFIINLMSGFIGMLPYTFEQISSLLNDLN